MFFCFGKKIYDTHWSENLLINCFGVQGYFFQNLTIEFTNFLLKQWWSNSLLNLLKNYANV